jgi:hypothetical protein
MKNRRWTAHLYASLCIHGDGRQKGTEGTVQGQHSGQGGHGEGKQSIIVNMLREHGVGKKKHSDQGTIGNKARCKVTR